MPRHVAIIMDGNGRWARKRGLPRTEGHRRGVENVREIVNSAREIGLEYLTLFAFSAENWNRPSNEVSFLMKLLENYLKKHHKELFKEGVRLKIIGDMEGLPKNLRAVLRDVIKETAHNDKGTLVVALNYGSRQETLAAVKAIAEDARKGLVEPENLDWAFFSKYLYTAEIPDPDLIIRTSGENRMSNFLLLQGAYAEFYLTETLWPDFGAEEFKKAINSYAKRERRYGLTGEQIRENHEQPNVP